MEEEKIFQIFELEGIGVVHKFFKCSFVLRVGAVIFELKKVTMSNFGKFKFLSKTFKIKRVFERRKK